MHSVTSAALLGLTASLAAAAPFAGRPGYAGPPNGWQPSTTLSTVAFPTETATNNVVPNLSNGFPKLAPGSKALNDTQVQAHGTLPNGAPPPSIQPATEGILRLIAFNELFEVAYFTALLQNVTNNVDGYQVASGGVRDFIVNTLTAVQAQEELHAVNANNALTKFTTAGPIQPCQYKFPVDNFEDAIALASTFTDVVLGTLQAAEFGLASDGDVGLIKGVASVIGQEGEQNGFYRSILGKTPSALPFLTTSTPQFAFSALNQNFVVPGSCPNIDTIDLPIFGALTVTNPPTAPVNTEITFQISAKNPPHTNSSSASIVYINQQNVPVVEEIRDIDVDEVAGVVTFKADFPGADKLMNGLTIAAVTATAGPFATADDVAKDTLFGPGLIEIN